LSIRCAGVGIYQLAPYRMYYFGTTPGGKVELREIALDEEVAKPPAGDAIVGAQARLNDAVERAAKDHAARRAIRVVVYVDDEEAAVEHVWQKRLADRFGEASKILERTCGMQLDVKKYGRWESDNSITDFHLSLREFERKVRPPNGELAVGFTSQYHITRGRTHLGGTRGPLHTHILLREWSRHVSEPERLELLVHELGHHLGAAHSPEAGSIMRPLLGDRQARGRAFRIAVDPLNALAMSIVGEEIRERGIISFGQLSQPARLRLAAVYSTLRKALPEDPAPGAYLGYIQLPAFGVR
jgi:hypothetical protein